MSVTLLIVISIFLNFWMILGILIGVFGYLYLGVQPRFIGWALFLITIKDKDGKTLVVLPLTVGVVGAVLVPVLAAVGTIAALVTECTITVERK